MNELEIVNGMIALIGELPVESLLEDHGYVPTARTILAEESRTLQAKGFYFNTEGGWGAEDPFLYPDDNGEILLPSDIIGIRALGDRVVQQRGTRLYDTGRRTFQFAQPIAVELIRELPLTDLPPIANDAVAAQARATFVARHGNASDQGPALAAARAMVALYAENTRQMNAFPLQGRGWRARLSLRRR